MSAAERDSHYANAAKRLISDLNTLGFDKDGYRSGEEKQKIIARFLFDFADYVIKHVHGSNLDEITDMGLARFLEEYGPEIGYERVPDMDTWPE